MHTSVIKSIGIKIVSYHSILLICLTCAYVIVSFGIFVCTLRHVNKCMFYELRSIYPPVSDIKRAWCINVSIVTCTTKVLLLAEYLGHLDVIYILKSISGKSLNIIYFKFVIAHFTYPTLLNMYSGT